MKILRYYKITLSEIVKIKTNFASRRDGIFLVQQEKRQLNRSQQLPALHKRVIDGLKQN